MIAKVKSAHRLCWAAAVRGFILSARVQTKHSHKNNGLNTNVMFFPACVNKYALYPIYRVTPKKCNFLKKLTNLVLISYVSYCISVKVQVD